MLSCSGLEIDLERLTGTVNEQPVALLAKELQLLLILAQNPQQVFHAEQLYKLIWNDLSKYTSDTIKSHIYYLRKKLEEDPKRPKYITTVKGFGYKFDPED